MITLAQAAHNQFYHNLPDIERKQKTPYELSPDYMYIT